MYDKYEIGKVIIAVNEKFLLMKLSFILALL